jgi:hypothetical protein
MDEAASLRACNLQRKLPPDHDVDDRPGKTFVTG